MPPQYLYRGDTGGLGTFCEIYRTEGLLTKEINGGDPAYVDRNGLLESVRAHVKPANISEQTFKERSKFFSFTSHRDRALFYASQGNPNRLTPSENYLETRLCVHIKYFEVSNKAIQHEFILC